MVHTCIIIMVIDYRYFLKTRPASVVSEASLEAKFALPWPWPRSEDMYKTCGGLNFPLSLAMEVQSSDTTLVLERNTNITFPFTIIHSFKQ